MLFIMFIQIIIPLRGWDGWGRKVHEDPKEHAGSWPKAVGHLSMAYYYHTRLIFKFQLRVPPLERLQDAVR
jgi:hypothetical protein